MSDLNVSFAYPPDIDLRLPPLIEAWLEIRWVLETKDSSPNLRRDRHFPIALGRFYEKILDRFPYPNELDTAQLPLDMSPYIVRHQFRREEDGWPLVQLGPGIATINFNENYDWKSFKKEVLFIRSALSDTYQETRFESERLALRYRNAEPFEYTSNSMLEFFQNNLNTSLRLPEHIPGASGNNNFISGANLFLSFNLRVPRAIGSIRFATAKRRVIDQTSGKSSEKDAILWQLEVVSEPGHAPAIQTEGHFATWLEAAHDVTHDWFFSTIDGPLRKKYEGEV
jgi:uncharacterized protein (TIGR04255 family)